MKRSGLIGALLLSWAFAPALAESPERCRLTEADLARNRTLTWLQFDQPGDIPKTAMWLSGEGCYAESVAAARDWLATGPMLSVREHAITTFHMARNAARAGDKSGAALLAAASRRSDQEPDAKLDWNSYVTGFYGYLVGDRAMTAAARAKLLAAGGDGNRTNARLLGRTLQCFDRPYLEVETSTACNVPTEAGR